MVKQQYCSQDSAHDPSLIPMDPGNQLKVDSVYNQHILKNLECLPTLPLLFPTMVGPGVDRRGHSNQAPLPAVLLAVWALKSPFRQKVSQWHGVCLPSLFSVWKGQRNYLVAQAT